MDRRSALPVERLLALTGRRGRPIIGPTMSAQRFAALALLLPCLVALSCAREKPAAPRAAPAPAAAPTAAASVVFLEGGATLARDGTSRPAEIGAAVPAGATVSTAAASRCDLKLGSLGILRILPLSTVELSLLDLDEGRRSLSARLVSGRVAAKVDKLGARDRFGIATQTAVCSVRGTEFVVAIAQGGSLRVAVKEGSVAVLPPALDPAALKSTPAAEAVYAALLAAAPSIGAGREASVSPREMEGSVAAWAKAEKAIAPLLEKSDADPAALLASAPFTGALASFAAAAAPLASAGTKAGIESAKDFAQFDSMGEPVTQGAAPPVIELSPPMTVIDDFADPSYEGSLNGSVWITEGSTEVYSPHQRKGLLRFEQAEPAPVDSSFELVAERKERIPLGDYRSLEGILGYESGASPGFSHIAINLRARGASEGDYWIEADLINYSDHPVILCRIGYEGSKGSKDEYRYQYDGGLKFGAAYAIRMDLDPAKGGIAWFLDGKKIASGTAPGVAANSGLAAEVILNGLRSKGSLATTTADRIAFARTRAP